MMKGENIKNKETNKRVENSEVSNKQIRPLYLGVKEIMGLEGCKKSKAYEIMNIAEHIYGNKKAIRKDMKGKVYIEAYSKYTGIPEQRIYNCLGYN